MFPSSETLLIWQRKEKINTYYNLLNYMNWNMRFGDCSDVKEAAKALFSHVIRHEVFFKIVILGG